MLGYSLGEFTAACLAGVFSLQDGLKLVAERGRLIQSMPAGSMLAVGLSEDECRALENEHVSLATVLEENHCVLSGVPEAIAALHTWLRLSLTKLRERIAVYRSARAAAGLDPDKGEVTLMLHTFIGPDMDYVRHHLTSPLREYLRSHMLHTQNVSAGQMSVSR